jgi:ABC-type transport system involved in cytochrome c biogenesis permease component
MPRRSPLLSCGVAMDTFDQSLVEARDSGTLEHLLVTQTSLPLMLAGSAIYPFLITTLRIAIYLIWRALLFHFPLGATNWFSVIVVLAASLLSFSGPGILEPATYCCSSAATPPNGCSSACGALPVECFFQ